MVIKGNCHVSFFPFNKNAGGKICQLGGSSMKNRCDISMIDQWGNVLSSLESLVFDLHIDTILRLFYVKIGRLPLNCFNYSIIIFRRNKSKRCLYFLFPIRSNTCVHWSNMKETLFQRIPCPHKNSDDVPMLSVFIESQLWMVDSRQPHPQVIPKNASLPLGITLKTLLFMLVSCICWFEFTSQMNFFCTCPEVWNLHLPELFRIRDPTSVVTQTPWKKTCWIMEHIYFSIGQSVFLP